ncbi:7725_t:CDS:2 [Ambispora gerdemannii]|uniref:7725_t:CDS:1 n=1 Tax=Ambispora gerdemannii TaxID=144530 RepID=A0A9N9BNX9_9GLOM|nr:7725_t:CDS:2 [Ambispora gerdemannii]
MDVDDNESAAPPPFDIFKSFPRYQAEAFRDLLHVSENSLRIDASEINFLRSVDRSAAKTLDTTGNKILSLINRLVANSGLLPATVTTGGPLLGNAEDIENKFSDIVEVIDSALEKADVCLDEYTGRAKEIAVPITASTPVVAQLSTNADTRILYAKNILRPQLRFLDTIDNSRAPFVPKIKEKPNATMPLQTNPADGDSMTIDIIDDSFGFPHPYKYEINHLEYPAHMFQVPNSDGNGQYMFGPIDTTTHIFISKEEELTALCAKLDTVQGIAVDLEHHDYRSFQGFTCLIQISTRDQDYILDAFTLRHAMHALNSSFTNPNIVKVFHGASSDVQWLQKDFGIYVVNLFDTFHASNVLALPQHSYAFLVKKYCGIEIDKRFQLADWRMRPLPTEMLNYARADTHYLLYIYDCMRNELLQKSPNLLQVTLDRSREVSLLKYEKERPDPETGKGNGGWKNDLSKCHRPFDNQQVAVFKALHAWRDTRAREEDESVRYVLPNNMLFELAQQMPIDASGVLSCCNPTPTLVRMHAIDIALLIERTKKEAEVSSNKPMEISKTLNNNSSEIVSFEKNLGNIATQIVNEFELPENEAARILAKTSKLFGKGLDEITEIDPNSFQIVTRLLESMGVSPSIPKNLNIEQNQIQQQSTHLFAPMESRKIKGKEREVVDDSSENMSVDQNPIQQPIHLFTSQESRRTKLPKGKEKEANVFSSNITPSKDVVEIVDNEVVSVPTNLEKNEQAAEIKNEPGSSKPALMQQYDNYIYTGESIRQMASKKRGRSRNKGKKKESNEDFAESSKKSLFQYVKNEQAQKMEEKSKINAQENTLSELNKHEDDLIADPSYDPDTFNFGPSGSSQVMGKMRKQRKAAQVARMKIYMKYKHPPSPLTPSRKKKKSLFDFVLPQTKNTPAIHDDSGNSSTTVNPDTSDYNDINKVFPPKPPKKVKKKSKGEFSKGEISKKAKKRVADARFWAQFEATFNGQTTLQPQGQTGQLHTEIPVNNNNSAFSLNSRVKPVINNTSTTPVNNNNNAFSLNSRIKPVINNTSTIPVNNNNSAFSLNSRTTPVINNTSTTSTTNNVMNLQSPFLFYSPNPNMNLSNNNRLGFPITSFSTVDHTALPSNIPTMQNTNSATSSSSTTSATTNRTVLFQLQSNNLFNNPPHQPQLPPPRTSSGLPYNPDNFGTASQSTRSNICHPSSAFLGGNRSMTFSFPPPPPPGSLNTNNNNNTASGNIHNNDNNNYTGANGERCIIQ